MMGGWRRGPCRSSASLSVAQTDMLCHRSSFLKEPMSTDHADNSEKLQRNPKYQNCASPYQGKTNFREYSLYFWGHHHVYSFLLCKNHYLLATFILFGRAGNVNSGPIVSSTLVRSQMFWLPFTWGHNKPFELFLITSFLLSHLSGLVSAFGLREILLSFLCLVMVVLCQGVYLCSDSTHLGSTHREKNYCHEPVTKG